MNLKTNTRFEQILNVLWKLNVDFQVFFSSLLLVFQIIWMNENTKTVSIMHCNYDKLVKKDFHLKQQLEQNTMEFVDWWSFWLFVCCVHCISRSLHDCCSSYTVFELLICQLCLLFFLWKQNKFSLKWT